MGSGIRRNCQKLKENRENGFTLMELIVVLVILAILAAIMIPSMLGWIDKAREKQVILQARSAYIAVQTIVMEYYAMGQVLEEQLSSEQIERAMELAGCEGSIESGTVDPDTWVITDFSYEEGNYRAFYRGGEIGVEGRAAAETPGWSVEKR